MASTTADIEKRGYGSGRVLLEDSSYMNWGNQLSNSSTPFFDNIMANRTVELSLSPNVPLSDLRDYTGNSVNGGAVAHDGSSYNITTTTSANSHGELQTRKRGEYVSGTIMVLGISITDKNTFTGDAYSRWGAYKGNTGAYFRKDANGIYVVAESNGTKDIEKPQSEWNLDSLDGNGPSGVDLDTADGLIYHIPIGYYGSLPLIWAVQVTMPNGFDKVIPVHVEKIKGKPSLTQANLPVSAEVDNGTTGNSYTLTVGGRQISRIGDEHKKGRDRGQKVMGLSIGTTPVYVMSMRHKSGFENIPVKFRSIEILSSVDATIELIRNPTLSGTNYTNAGFVSSEVATEWDTAGTYTAGSGDLEDFFAVNGGGQTQLTEDMLPEKPISEYDTWATRIYTTSGSGTASIFIKAEEKW